MKLLIATTNPGKIRETLPLLQDLGLEIVTLADLPPIDEPAETGRTFWENARIKALAYAAASGLTTLAEDSGMAIDALDGAPGVYSARFLGDEVSFADRFREIERRLASMPSAPRTARFVTAVAVARGRDFIYEGEAVIEGEVARTPQGTGGFGYDPIFLYPPLGMTTASLPAEDKRAVSHRGRAIRDVARWLRSSFYTAAKNPC